MRLFFPLPSCPHLSFTPGTTVQKQILTVNSILPKVNIFLSSIIQTQSLFLAATTTELCFRISMTEQNKKYFSFFYISSGGVWNRSPGSF